MAKLTLSVEPEKIEKAKRYALEHHTSVSKLFSDFLGQVIEMDKINGYDPLTEKLSQLTIPEEVNAFAGILKGKYPDDITLWDAKWEYLKEKHDL